MPIFKAISRIWLSLFSLGLSLILGFEAQALESLSILAPQYHMVGERVTAWGGVEVEYQEYHIVSNYAWYDRQTGRLRMEGDVVITSSENRFKTPFFEFNTKNREGFTGSIRGEVLDAKTPSLRTNRKSFIPEHRHYHFSAVSANVDQNEFKKMRFRFISPSFTDCDRESPHHDLKASTATFSQGEKLEFWNIRPRIFKVPYFYLPYAIRDLQYPWPWTRWVLGSKAEWGRFAEVTTNAFPKKLKERSKVAVAYRTLRGVALKQDWSFENEKMRNRISTHFYHENWRSLSGSGPEIQQDRIRADFFHRHRLNESLDATIEFHHLTPRKKYFWDNGVDQAVSSTQFASPLLGGGTQERQTLFQDYYEEEFERGRTLENTVSLDFNRERHAINLSTLQPVDEERPTSTIRDFVFSGRALPQPVGSTKLLHSFEYGAVRHGIHFGNELNANDNYLVFRNFNPQDFQSMRAHFEQKLEHPFSLGRFLEVRPYIGARSIFYEKILKTPGAALQDLNTTDMENGFDNHRFLMGALWSNTITGFFSSGLSKFRHLIRSSISMDYISPSTFNNSFVPVRVDNIDNRSTPFLQTVYRIDNQIFRRRDRQTRLYYSSSLAFSSFLKSEDREITFGPTLNRGENLTLSQNLYPQSWLRLSSDLRYNTFHGELSQIRTGTRIETERVDFGWDLVHLDAIGSLEPALSRHDFFLTGAVKWGFDYDIRVSWDANPRGNQRRSLYQHGFRSVDIALGQNLHCLRMELQYQFDFESTGSTIIFKFGPQILGDSKPGYRQALGSSEEEE